MISALQLKEPGFVQHLKSVGPARMHEVHCPHCKAVNRRPKCGSCQKEIADPPAIEFAWKLYEYRKTLRYIAVGLGIMALLLAIWRPIYFFAPTNRLECREQAARTARSNEAMRVLLIACQSKFSD